MTAASDVRIHIQRGIPIPTVKPRGPGGSKLPTYPWREMEIGDSFLFPESIGRASYSAAIQASQNGRKYVVRAVDGRFRCWRVE